MNGIQRVLNAIHRVPGAPVPRGELVIDQKFMEDLFRWRGRKTVTDQASEEEKLMECCRLLNLELVCIQSERTGKDSKEDLEQLRQISILKDAGLFVFWIVNGAFQTAMNHMGFNEFFVNIAQRPESVAKDIRQISRQVVSTIEQGLSAGAHGIIIADDIAHNKNTYVAPAFCENHILALWQEQVSVAQNRKVPVFFHSDGNINSILPILVAAGFDGLQCIEPAAGMDIKEIKRQYGKHLCLMGNIDPALLSDHNRIGEPDKDNHDLTLAVESLMASAAPGGGFIFGSCSGLHAGMSPQKVHFMFELARKISLALL